MSGRKQHYIPQFLVRKFALAGSGKKFQVRVVGRDKSFVAATDGIAAQRDFYSGTAESQDGLDAAITTAEIGYAEILDRLCAMSAGPIADPLPVARLLSHLAVRGSYLRDVFSLSGAYILDRVVEKFVSREGFMSLVGLNAREPEGAIKNSLDKLYDENRSAIRSGLRLSRHEFRRFAFTKILDNFDELFLSSVPLIKAVTSGLNVKQLMSEAHQKALSETFEPGLRVESLSQLEWHIFDFADRSLVLPDCIAISNYNGVGALPVGFIGADEMDGVFFPISPSRAACAGTYADGPVIDALSKSFQFFAAITSWDFFICHPETSLENGINSVISSAIIKFIAREVEEALRDEFADMVPKAIAGMS